MKNVFTFLMILFINITFSQVGIGTNSPTPNSALQVTSLDSDKGILIPQLSSEQRNNMVLDESERGLMVFNTDTGCFDYYHSSDQSWLSLCGGSSPAEARIDNCGGISAKGTYIQGANLTINNYLSIPVNVIKSGTFTIIAEVENNNGYYFSKSGTLSKTGEYVLNLEGAGVPKDIGTDNIVITINGQRQICNYPLTIRDNTPDYRITNVVVNPSSYPLMVSLEDRNTYYLNVTLEVTTPGEWQLTTSTVNGYSFGGRGNIEDASGYNPSGSFPQIVTVQIPAYGMAQFYNSQGFDQFTLSTVNSATASHYPFPVKLTNVGFTVDCDGIVLEGSFKQNRELTGNETITLPIEVTSTGETIITASCAGMIFSSDSLIFTSTGPQVVILKPTSTAGPNDSGNLSFVLSSTEGGMNNVCEIPVSIEAQKAVFQFGVPIYTNNGNYVVNRLGESVPITVTIPVTTSTAGVYTLSVTENGVTYQASGNLAMGDGSIILQPQGTPTEVAGPVDYTITNNDGFSVTFTVNYVHAKLNILSLGNNNNSVYSITGIGAARKFAYSNGSLGNINIGTNGTIKMDGAPNFLSSISTGASLADVINTNNIDIIFLNYDYDLNYFNSAATVNVLNDFVKNKKGALVFSSEYNPDTTQSLLTAIFDQQITVAKDGATLFNPSLNIDDPILNGPFMDLRASGIGFGSDVNNAYYIYSPFPANSTLLASQNGNSDRAWLLKHNNYGFVFIGDSGWMAGDANSASIDLTLFPFMLNADNTPRFKTYTGGQVYNSFLLGNILSWAIQWVTENEDINYQVTAN